MLLVLALLWAPTARHVRAPPRRMFEDLSVDDGITTMSSVTPVMPGLPAVPALPEVATPAAVVLTVLALFNRLPLSPRDVISARAPPPPPLQGSTPLAGTRWTMLLDFGREKNTWMPPRWAASGRRVEVPLLLELGADGCATPVRAGKFLDFPLKPGRWRVVGTYPEQRLQLWIETDGYVRGDNVLPPGPLYLSTNVFGRQPSSKPGVMTIEATRLLVRRERRMVGTFKTVAAVEPDEDPNLPPARMYIDSRNVR